ncbi:MAG: hypothetical protein AB7K36_31605 [Chloroflexota bacterium]
MAAWAMVIVGALLDLIGTVWILQGLNILPGSFMTGQPFWAGAGVVAMITGMVLLILGVRRRADGG